MLSVKVRRHLLTIMKKKFTSLLLVLLFALPALAQQFEYDGLWYNVIDEEAKLCAVAYTSSVKGDLTIPATAYNDGNVYSVIAIQSGALNYTDLTSVVLPESVTTIGASAFRGCFSLTSVILPASVTTIGASAFSGCFSLTSVVIPDGVTVLAESVFSDCKSLTSIIIPKSVTVIENNAFNYCESLTSIVIPENVTTIQQSAFFLCLSLTSIYYYAENLTKAPFNTFSDYTYENATLYLRESALNQALYIEPWSRFVNKNGVKVGVEGIAANADVPVEVYNLGGVKVANSTDDLPTGVYVVRQGKEVRKISVK